VSCRFLLKPGEFGPRFRTFLDRHEGHLERSSKRRRPSFTLMQTSSKGHQLGIFHVGLYWLLLKDFLCWNDVGLPRTQGKGLQLFFFSIFIRCSLGPRMVVPVILIICYVISMATLFSPTPIFFFKENAFF